jgi:hypothetical protein
VSIEGLSGLQLSSYINQNGKSIEYRVSLGIAGSRDSSSRTTGKVKEIRINHWKWMEKDGYPETTTNNKHKIQLIPRLEDLRST